MSFGKVRSGESLEIYIKKFRTSPACFLCVLCSHDTRVVCEFSLWRCCCDKWFFMTWLPRWIKPFVADSKLNTTTTASSDSTDVSVYAQWVQQYADQYQYYQQYYNNYYSYPVSRCRDWWFRFETMSVFYASSSTIGVFVCVQIGNSNRNWCFLESFQRAQMRFFAVLAKFLRFCHEFYAVQVAYCCVWRIWIIPLRPQCCVALSHLSMESTLRPSAQQQ